MQLCEVLDELNLSTSYSELSKSISTSNPTNTRFLQVSVTSTTPAQAKMIVDKLCEIGVEKITGAMGFNQANIFEFGILNENPSNAVGITKYLIAGIAAALVVYFIYIVIFLLDDSIYTGEEIEQVLGVTILGEIPNADDSASGKKKKYGKYGYGRYGYGKQPYGKE